MPVENFRVSRKNETQWTANESWQRALQKLLKI